MQLAYTNQKSTRHTSMWVILFVLVILAYGGSVGV